MLLTQSFGPPAVRTWSSRHWDFRRQQSGDVSPHDGPRRKPWNNPPDAAMRLTRGPCLLRLTCHLASPHAAMQLRLETGYVAILRLSFLLLHRHKSCCGIPQQISVTGCGAAMAVLAVPSRGRYDDLVCGVCPVCTLDVHSAKLMLSSRGCHGERDGIKTMVMSDQIGGSIRSSVSRSKSNSNNIHDAGRLCP